MKQITALAFLMLLFVLPVVRPEAAAAEAATRIKELISLEGARDNQLMGYGLVVGLAGTGDKRQTVFSAQTLTNILQRMGVTVTPTAIQVRNTAAVLITATLPAFAQTGSRIDLTAAAIGDATTLQGGILILTPLKAADGQTYAVAQGPLVTGGFIAGRRNNGQTVNHPTTARIPGGAIVERAAPTATLGKELRLVLRSSDFTTASRIAATVNRRFTGDSGPIARAESAAAVVVSTPAAYSARAVDFVAELESLNVEADHRLKVVVNERTGTIVLGKDVRIAPTAIVHGNLTVEIQTIHGVSQPEPLSAGKTTETRQTNVNATEDKAREVVLKQGATVEELVKALVSIGSTPRDIIVVLQNLRASGALEAELEVI
jgi:flagellar P-ring protein FlgI